MRRGRGSELRARSRSRSDVLPSQGYGKDQCNLGGVFIRCRSGVKVCADDTAVGVLARWHTRKDDRLWTCSAGFSGMFFVCVSVLCRTDQLHDPHNVPTSLSRYQLSISKVRKMDRYVSLPCTEAHGIRTASPILLSHALSWTQITCFLVHRYIFTSFLNSKYKV